MAFKIIGIIFVIALIIWALTHLKKFLRILAIVVLCIFALGLIFRPEALQTLGVWVFSFLCLFIAIAIFKFIKNL
jgi:hypothetical protein